MHCSLCGFTTEQCAITAQGDSICYSCINKGIQQFEVISCWRTGAKCLHTYKWSFHALQSAIQTDTPSVLTQDQQREEAQADFIESKTDTMDRQTQISSSSMYHGDSPKKSKGQKSSKLTFY
jgi:hypothetical protein